MKLMEPGLRAAEWKTLAAKSRVLWRFFDELDYYPPFPRLFVEVNRGSGHGRLAEL
jgi:hypothetical protein